MNLKLEPDWNSERVLTKTKHDRKIQDYFVRNEKKRKNIALLCNVGPSIWQEILSYLLKDEKLTKQ